MDRGRCDDTLLLLNNVREFVGKKTSAGRRIRAVLAFSKDNVIANRVCTGLDCRRRFRSIRVSVYLNPVELDWRRWRGVCNWRLVDIRGDAISLSL